MAARFNLTSLIPPGLMVDSVDDGEDTLVVTARSGTTEASCPVCGAASRRVRSHYVRHSSDLPCSGRRVACNSWCGDSGAMCQAVRVRCLPNGSMR